MIQNMERHKVEEITEKKQWKMWQALQLKSLERYRQQNQKKYGAQFAKMNQKIEALIREAKQAGNMEQEVKILQAIKRGYKGLGRNKSPAHQAVTAEFFKLNERKLEALIKATIDDMKKAETAILRMANDQYRKAIFNAQVYANTGAGTYEKAVDMATKDMLSAGLNCVEYANGARHTLKDYADMVIKTASKRAYLQGEGAKRQEWGISTVIMNKRGNPCPKCLPFCGKVLIDDVWSGGSQKDGPYPLMSSAIAAGLYHPRCKDSHTTYFQGISSPDDKYSKEELEKIAEDYQKEQKQQYAKRQVEKFGRMEKYSLDGENRKKYKLKKVGWEQLEKINISDIIELTEDEQLAINQYISFDFYVINDKLRNGLEFTELEKKMLNNLDNALKKMSKYEGTVSRSLYFGDNKMVEGFISRFKIGHEISFKEYLSTTNANELYNPDGEIQIFVENSKRGRNVANINVQEKEVLYERNSNFIVLNVVKQNDKYWILLEEK